MRKDYSYVLKNGVKVYENAPKERQRHLARIISESYLAKGNTAKAKEYYDVARSGDNDMDRNDYFYAARFSTPPRTTREPSRTTR